MVAAAPITTSLQSFENSTKARFENGRPLPAITEIFFRSGLMVSAVRLAQFGYSLKIPQQQSTIERGNSTRRAISASRAHLLHCTKAVGISQKIMWAFKEDAQGYPASFWQLAASPDNQQRRRKISTQLVTSRLDDLAALARLFKLAGGGLFCFWLSSEPPSSSAMSFDPYGVIACAMVAS